MLAATTLFAWALFQDPATRETPPESTKQAAPAVVVKTLTKAEAKAVVASFTTAAKDKDATLAQRLEAVEQLGKGSHDNLVKPLARVVRLEKALTVRRAAARALGHQPDKKARPAILKLLGDKKVTETPELGADLVHSLRTAGYERGKDWKVLEPLFEESFEEAYRARQKAIVELAADQIELESLDLLCRHLDEPAPSDVDAASNPPAEYWEARWKSWRVWRTDVQAALLAITGQRFSTADEARTWIKANRKKLEKRTR